MRTTARALHRKSLLPARTVGFLLLQLLVTQIASAASALELQRAGFQAGWKAAVIGQESVARAAHRSLRDYPAAPYLKYAWLRHGLAESDEDEVDQFLRDQESWPVAIDLRRRWLKVLADAGRWEDVAAYYRPTLADAASECLYLESQIREGWNPKLGVPQRDLWLSGGSRPDECDAVFRHWMRAGELGDALVMERLSLAARAGQWRLAEYLKGQIKDAGSRREADQIMDIHRDPARVLPALGASASASRWTTEAGVFAMQKLTRSDNASAWSIWPVAKPLFSGSEGLAGSLERDLALFKATDYPTDARQTLIRLDRDVVDQQIVEWRARLAILEGDWAALLEDIKLMDDMARADSKWQYWEARALAETGAVDAANARFKELSVQANFHGFLAADRLGADYTICPAEDIPSAEDRRALVTELDLRLAIELFHADLVVHARRHWRQADAIANSSGERTAGWLANDEGWHHQAILSLANAGAVRDYEARFPLSFQEAAKSAITATSSSLPVSFPLAIMRSESALDPRAVSSADAIGLMQVQLGTARKIAGVVAWPEPSRANLLDAEVNVRYGVANLWALQEEYAHPLKIMAAYNAGPEPLEEWLKAGRMPTEADRWIESVPYYETRDYIPRVLAFQTLYQWRLGQPVVRISEYLAGLDQSLDYPDWSTAETVAVQCKKEES